MTGTTRGRTLAALAGVTFVTLALSGCTAFYWSKPGTTQEQFTMDNQDCAKQAMPTPAAVNQGVMVQDVYRGCLVQRGYVRSKQYKPVGPEFFRGIE
ncbi:MAG TPA: hypothetical protein VL948_18945 [Verrucomicrobiae bacterium]|jgi:hypothetical protein|nr:hypothetical protein [Verrucomicrobiae bacterium]